MPQASQLCSVSVQVNVTSSANSLWCNCTGWLGIKKTKLLLFSRNMCTCLHMHKPETTPPAPQNGIIHYLTSCVLKFPAATSTLGWFVCSRPYLWTESAPQSRIPVSDASDGWAHLLLMPWRGRLTHGLKCQRGVLSFFQVSMGHAHPCFQASVLTHVLKCQRGMFTHVLKCQRGMLTHVLKYQRGMLTHVLKCQRDMLTHVFKWQRSTLTHVLKRQRGCAHPCFEVSEGHAHPCF